MIKSMTGFGRGEASDGDRKITIEMKSVNHRYFEPSIKMPKKLNFYEAGIRTELKKYINRGKVDIFISYEDYTENQYNLKYNETLAASYMEILKKISEQFEIDNDVKHPPYQDIRKLSQWKNKVMTKKKSGLSLKRH